MGKHNKYFTTGIDAVNFQDLMKYGNRISSGCIEWTKRTNFGGYGIFKIKSQATMVHRYVARLMLGDPIAESMYAMHLCDNPPCFNPDHLRWGTPLENTQDMDSKGRAKRTDWSGEKMFTAKLTDSLVCQIRDLYGYGFSLRELAQIYEVDHTNISLIVRGRTWKHLLMSD